MKAYGLPIGTGPLSVILLALSAAACGPSYAPVDAPSRPCPEITEAEFQSALDDGAARGDARVYSSGTVNLRFGPGVEHCATFNAPLRPCRRPVDLVIRYEFDDGSVRHVRAAAGSQYRFNAGAQPTTCEIVNEDPPGG